MEETIREYGGKVIGFVNTEANGNKTVRSFYGHVLGWYDASANATSVFGRGFVAEGDAAVGLLFDPRYNPDLGK